MLASKRTFQIQSDSIRVFILFFLHPSVSACLSCFWLAALQHGASILQMAGTGGSGIAATTSIAVATTTRGDAQQTATHVPCTKTTNTSNSSSCSRPTSKTRGATCATTTTPNESGCHTAAKDATSPADAMPSSSSVPSPPIATHSTGNTSADSKTNTACPASTACLFYACAVPQADATCTAGPHVLSLCVTWIPLSTFFIHFAMSFSLHSFFYFFLFSAFQQGSLWVSSVIF